MSDNAGTERAIGELHGRFEMFMEMYESDRTARHKFEENMWEEARLIKHSYANMQQVQQSLGTLLGGMHGTMTTLKTDVDELKKLPKEVHDLKNKVGELDTTLAGVAPKVAKHERLVQKASLAAGMITSVIVMIANWVSNNWEFIRVFIFGKGHA